MGSGLFGAVPLFHFDEKAELKKPKKKPPDRAAKPAATASFRPKPIGGAKPVFALSLPTGTTIAREILNEQELIDGCLRADPRAQRRLYEQHAPKMYAVCLRYARTPSDAADILQDGFIKVYQNLTGFRFQGSFEGWIRRIMVNTAIRMYSRHRFQFEKAGIDDLRHDSSFEPDALARMSENELLRIVNGLPDGYRIVFNLAAIEGYSHAEVADLLGIEESTSRSQLTKARRMLVRQVEELQKMPDRPETTDFLEKKRVETAFSMAA